MENEMMFRAVVFGWLTTLSVLGLVNLALSFKAHSWLKVNSNNILKLYDHVKNIVETRLNELKRKEKELENPCLNRSQRSLS